MPNECNLLHRVPDHPPVHRSQFHRQAVNLVGDDLCDVPQFRLFGHQKGEHTGVGFAGAQERR